MFEVGASEQNSGFGGSVGEAPGSWRFFEGGRCSSPFSIPLGPTLAEVTLFPFHKITPESNIKLIGMKIEFRYTLNNQSKKCQSKSSTAIIYPMYLIGG